MNVLSSYGELGEIVVQGVVGTTNNQLAEIQQLFHHYSKNVLLDQHFDSQYNHSDFSKSAIPILYIMLKSSGLPMNTIHSLCTASALIESGINIHETIEHYACTENTSRQLTVLAGDYYSSKYYKLLSDENLPQAIRAISKSVQQINEAKMSRHFTKINQISSNLYITWLEKIHASIACNLVEEYGIDKSIWHTICLNVMLIHGLNHEIEWIPTYKGKISFQLVLLYEAMGSPNEELFLQQISNKDHLRSLLKQYNIDQSIARYKNSFISTIQTAMENIEYKFVKDELSLYIKELCDSQLHQRIVCE